MKLWKTADGTTRAMLTAGEQGALEIPVTTVTIQGMDLKLEARSVSGTYRGTLGADGEIAGEWSESSEHFPLTFKRVPSETKK